MSMLHIHTASGDVEVINKTSVLCYWLLNNDEGLLDQAYFFMHAYIEYDEVCFYGMEVFFSAVDERIFWGKFFAVSDGEFFKEYSAFKSAISCAD